MMSKRKKIAACIVFLSVFFIASCEWDGNFRRFDSDLWGVWVSNVQGPYAGTLTIEFDRITITGFPARSTPPWEPNVQPFRNIPRNVPMRGYSENGRIFIEVAGAPQGGIPFRLAPLAGNWGSQEWLLSFEFGGSLEHMQRQE